MKRREKTMIYGYARVSSKGQLRDGNGLEEQREKLLQAGCQEIVEEQYTGTTMNRPMFNELLGKLKADDTLIVTKLDRFARTAGDGSNIAKDLLNKGIKLHILNMGLIDSTPIGKLVLTCLLGFAEFERDMIVERTQAGKAIARTKAGFKEGRPAIKADKINNALDLLDNGKTYKEVVSITGISKSTLIRAMNKRKAQQQTPAGTPEDT